jgi:CheY-like chemotaxis protein
MSKTITVLLADDDEEDCMLTKDAFIENHLTHDLRIVRDGEDLMGYLNRRGTYSDPNASPRPGLILLDLNMPRKSGREALMEIKSDPTLQQIPVIILTTSRSDQDIHQSYRLGANSYIVKPITYSGLVAMVQSLKRYWFESVELPSSGVGR